MKYNTLASLRSPWIIVVESQRLGQQHVSPAVQRNKLAERPLTAARAAAEMGKRRATSAKSDPFGDDALEWGWLG